MARSQIRQSDALRRARERQRELDRQEDEAREVSRARIADASAAAIISLERRADAEQALAAATSAAGEAVRALLAKDVDVERAAALLELDLAGLRRLLKAAPRMSSGADTPRSTRTDDETPVAGAVTASSGRGGAPTIASNPTATADGAGRRGG